MDKNMEQRSLLQEIKEKQKELDQMIDEAILNNGPILQPPILIKSIEVNKLIMQYYKHN